MDRKIINRDEVIKQLTEMLMTFDKECHRYQTEVYLYFNPNTNIATLDTFVLSDKNVKSNKRPEDDPNNDYYTIYCYCDSKHYSNWGDFFKNDDAFALGLGMSVDDFNKEVLDFLNLDDGKRADYKIKYYDKYDYVKSRHDYCEKLTAVYKAYIDEHRAEYAERAKELIDRGEEEIEIVKRVREIEDELGKDLYTFYTRSGFDQRIISNGNGYFILSEKSYNGEFYKAYRCSKYGEILENAQAECVNMTPVYLETADDEYEDIGYEIGDIGTVYTMDGKWENGEFKKDP